MSGPIAMTAGGSFKDNAKVRCMDLMVVPWTPCGPPYCEDKSSLCYSPEGTTQKFALEVRNKMERPPTWVWNVQYFKSGSKMPLSIIVNRQKTMFSSKFFLFWPREDNFQWSIFTKFVHFLETLSRLIPLNLSHQVVAKTFRGTHTTRQISSNLTE